MPPIKGSNLEVSIARLNNTAYATPRGSGDDYRRIIDTSLNLAAMTTNYEDNAGHAHGSDMKQRKWATTADGQKTFNPDFCFQDIGFFLKDALGTYSVSGSAAPYIHVFTPQDTNTSAQLPARTALEKWGSLLLRRIDSLCCTQLQINTTGPTGLIKVSAQYQGSGAFADDPASYASPALTEDREWGHSSQAGSIRINDNDDGTAQVETATAAGSASGAGNVNVTITAAGMAGSPLLVPVAVAGSETAAQWADKVRIALRNNLVVSNFFNVTGATTAIILTARVKAANDATMNIAIDANGTGVTDAANSANTTAGVVGDYQTPGCELETWSLTINNPLMGDGYRTCSDYIVSGDPESGQTRSEFLIGSREYQFEFSVRLAASDKMRAWMKAGTDVTLDIPIIGTDAGNSSLRMTHTRCHIDAVSEGTDLGGGFFGYTGTLDLMSSNGLIPFTATLMNDVASYAS